MPGYLIKAANFVAEIRNDDELIHLAGVDTIKKDTLICVMPGKEWIEAKKLPLLRKFWGLEADTVPPPIPMNVKSPVAPIKSKLPPRLETVIDSIPRFPDAESDDTQNATSNDAQNQQFNTSDNLAECRTEKTVKKRAYQSIASDIVGIVEESSEIMDMNAIARAAESSLTFEIDKVQNLVSSHTWHDASNVHDGDIAPKPNTLAKQNILAEQDTCDVQELDDCLLTVEDDAEDDIQDVADCFAMDTVDQQSVDGSPAVSKTDMAHDLNSGIAVPLETMGQKLPSQEVHHVAAQNDINPDQAQTAYDAIQESAQTTNILGSENQNDANHNQSLNVLSQNISDANPALTENEHLAPPTMAHDVYLEAAPHEPTYVIDSRVIEKPRENAPELPVSSDMPDDDSLEIPIDLCEDDDIEDMNDKTCALGSAGVPDHAVVNVPAVPENKPEQPNRNWRDNVSAQMFVPDSVPEDLMMQIAEMMDDNNEPGEKTQVTPSPLHVHTSSRDNAASLSSSEGIKPFNVDKSEGIRPYRPGENKSAEDEPVIQFADDRAPTKARFRMQKSDESAHKIPNEKELQAIEEADTGAWQANKQAAAVQEMVMGQRFSSSIAQELKAAKAAVEAAKAASERSEKIDSSMIEPMLHLFDAIEEAQTKSYAQLSAEAQAQNPSADLSVCDVPEDYLDENPSDIFKIRNRKDLLKQLEESAMMERAQKAFEAAPTLKKKPETCNLPKDSLSLLEEDSHSDKLKVRGRSELRRMLAAEARAAEMDSVHAMSIVTTEDYAENCSNKGQLRSLFEKEGELHLYLANEIKTKESQVNLEPVNQEPQPEAPKKEHSITDDLPRRNAHAVAVAKPRVVEPTMVTGRVVQESAVPTSFDDPFFNDKLVDGETAIAKFDTLFLTTHRIWFIEGDKKHIRVYESHDIENIKWVAKSEQKSFKLLIIDAVLAVIFFVMSRMLPEFQFIFTALAIFCVCLLPLLYIVCFKKTIQIGLSDKIVLKSNAAITKNNSIEAMEFLNRVEAARHERKRQLNKY